jgi:hypothetical protein
LTLDVIIGGIWLFGRARLALDHHRRVNRHKDFARDTSVNKLIPCISIACTLHD